LFSIIARIHSPQALSTGLTSRFGAFMQERKYLQAECTHVRSSMEVILPLLNVSSSCRSSTIKSSLTTPDRIDA
jgi:hypothetical protein